jgi:hypothetical protein
MCTAHIASASSKYFNNYIFIIKHVNFFRTLCDAILPIFDLRSQLRIADVSHYTQSALHWVDNVISMKSESIATPGLGTTERDRELAQETPEITEISLAILSRANVIYEFNKSGGVNYV